MAIEYFKEVVAIDSSDAMAYINIGMAYSELGNYKEDGYYVTAIEYYKKCIWISPNSPSPYLLTAMAYANLGDVEKAGEYGKKYEELADKYRKDWAFTEKSSSFGSK